MKTEKMQTWHVGHELYDSGPCGCKYGPRNERLTHAFEDTDGLSIDCAECTRCGATWDEWDDLVWRGAWL